MADKDVLPSWIKLNHTEKGLSVSNAGWLSFLVNASHHDVSVKNRKEVIKKVLEQASGHKCFGLNTSNRSSKAKRRVAAVSNRFIVVYAKFGADCESVYQKVRQL